MSFETAPDLNDRLDHLLQVMVSISQDMPKSPGSAFLGDAFTHVMSACELSGRTVINEEQVFIAPQTAEQIKPTAVAADEKDTQLFDDGHDGEVLRCVTDILSATTASTSEVVQAVNEQLKVGVFESKLIVARLINSGVLSETKSGTKKLVAMNDLY